MKERIHRAHTRGHSAVRSTLLCSGAPRFANESRRQIAFFRRNFGDLDKVYLKITNETKDSFIQIGCLCK